MAAASKKSILFKGDGYIQKSEALENIRNSLITDYKNYKFDVPKTTKSKKTLWNTYDDEKETIHIVKRKEQSMFDSVKHMESMMNVKGTILDRDLMKMEKKLISDTAKKHISRICRGKACLMKAPADYPNNIYLCDKCKITFSKKLECDIACNKGSSIERQKCRDLKVKYQSFVDSVRIPDRQQSFNKQHLYPSNYFSVAMAKLIYGHQQISKLNTSSFGDKQRKTAEQFKAIIEKLMDLLIICRQNLNDFWEGFFKFILDVIAQIDFTSAELIKYISSLSAYTVALYACIGVMVGVIIYLLIFGDDKEKLIGGCAAIGMGIGMWAGPVGAISGGLIGGGIGAVASFFM